MDNCCNPIQYYSTLFFFLSSFFFFFSNFHAFNFSIVCIKAIAIVLSSNSGEKSIDGSRKVFFFPIYILDRFNFSSIAYLDRSKLLHPLLPCDLFSKGVSQQDFEPNDHVERLDSRKRQFSRRLQFNPADVSTCRIILRYYITSFRLRDADISRHGCTFQFVRQIRSFRLNRGI